jgi:hypothetical protein
MGQLDSPQYVQPPPQAQGAVQGTHQQKLAIRRETCERHRRVVVVYECFEARARGDAPQAAQAVVAAGHQHRGVAAQVQFESKINVKPVSRVRSSLLTLSQMEA